MGEHDSSAANRESEETKIEAQSEGANAEEESKGGLSIELERGQIQKVSPDTDSVLNSDAEQSQSVVATASTEAAHSESAQQSVQENPEPAQEPEEEEKKEVAAAPDDGLPLVEETKEVAENRRS